MFFEKLKEETQSEQNYFLSAPIIENVMNGQFTLATYIAFLNQAYHHVRHTVPLLMQAGARLSHKQQTLQQAIAEYIQEEAGHEQWILNDIEACGESREVFEFGPAPFDSELMVSFLYDTVQRGNPVGIFGMVLVLEGTSADLATPVGKLVQDKLGLPDSAMTYLTSHGALDQDHMRGFEALMNTITDSDDQAAIIHVARMMYRLYGNVYRAVEKEAENFKTGVAA